MRKYFLEAIIFLALVAMLLAGCIGGEKAEKTEKTGIAGQVLKIGAVKDFKQATEGRSLIFETLVDVDKYGNPTPLLAESWEVSKDGLTYVFHLRKGIKFHDDTPFNAKAAKFAIEYSINHGAAYGKYVESIKVKDNYTIEVHFKKYYYPFLLDLASEFRSKIISPTAVKPEWNASGKLVKFIGTGPFKLVSYKEDEYAELVRNEEYWGTKPKLEKVIWKTIPDPHSLVLALEGGEVDIIGAPEHHSAIPYQEVPRLKKEKGIVVTTHSYGRYQVLRINTFKEPLNDVKVRQALNYAINREKMVSVLFHNITSPAYLDMCPWFKYGPRDLEGWKYDIEKARSLLKEAGWEDTDGDGIVDKEGKPLEIELLVPEGEANADAVAVYAQSELKKIGVKLKIITLESGAAWSKRKKGDFEIFVHHSGCIPWSPQGILWQNYYSKAPGYAKHYTSKELDNLIEKVYTTRDDEERDRYYQEIWRILKEEATTIPLYDIVKVVAYRDYVKGFKHAPTMYKIDLTNIEVVK